MSDYFTLNYLYKGVTEEISCSLRVSAFTYQFLCTIDDTEIILEKDDEGNLRVLSADPFSSKKKSPDPIRVLAVKNELERILLEKNA
jgi:hypothetical protein